MRRFAVAAALLVLAACGSSVAPTGVLTPPPPPSAPGAPATIVLVTGDGQTAAPGAILPVKLSVQVKDASGIPVPAVVVHFAIDSGGGSLSASSVTTGSDGTATGVTWTLGSGSGTNVVAVTVATLAVVRFHAQALGVTARTIFASTSVGAGGGTLTYTKAGDPLSGLTITVMPSSYPTSSVWSIVADSSLTVPLPSGFSQVGPTLVIGNGQGFADSVMTLTMPMNLGSGIAVAPFYFDPATGTLEGIPLVSRTNSSATLATHHFSADLMAIPGSGSVASLRSSLRQGFGEVRIVWVAIPQAQLAGTYASSFFPGTDDWEFDNYGDYVSPGGDCEGMSITAMYYHYFYRLNRSPAPGLYHHYDQSLANQWDNVQGIRFAGSVQGDYSARWFPGINQIATLLTQAGAAGAQLADLTASWLVLTLKVTGRPVLLGLRSGTDGHAVVAYAASSVGDVTTISYADPNNAGDRDLTLTFTNGELDPVQLKINVGEQPHTFTVAYALGVSAEVPLAQVTARWTEFAQQHAGADRYPASYHVEIQNQFDQTWGPLTTNSVTYSQSVLLRTICNDCFASFVNPVESLQIWSADGSQLVHLTGAMVMPVGPPASFNAIEMAASRVGGTGFIDLFPFSIGYQAVTITAPSVWALGLPVTFTVQNPPAEAGAHYQYQWTFSDGTDPLVTDGPTAVHPFTESGTYTVRAAITDLRTGHVVAQPSITNGAAPLTESFQYSISGTWSVFRGGVPGSYAYTDVQSGRAPNIGLGVDALISTADTTAIADGVLLTLLVPAGQALTAGQTFSKIVVGQQGGAGQFQLSLSVDLRSPSGTQPVPGTGTLTIDAVAQLSDGTFVAQYSFSILNGASGVISGSGVAKWK